jgi:BirA family biotin operon repressor/biotin-[acetyl-CoA-carboxylase] ligase
LLERNAERVAVGFGVNLASAPDLADRKAAALGGQITPEAFAPLLAGSFARMLNLWRTSSPDSFAQAWLARAHLPGTRLAVHVSSEETISGRFAGLEPDGALRLIRDDGTMEVIRAGDVEL